LNSPVYSALNFDFSVLNLFQPYVWQKQVSLSLLQYRSEYCNNHYGIPQGMILYYRYHSITV